MNISPRVLEWTGRAFMVAGGAMFGVATTKVVLGKKYAALATEEIEDAKKYYSRLHKTGNFSSPVDLVETTANDTAESLIQELQYDTGSDKVEVSKNIFADQAFDQDKENAKRKEGKPYVITVGEFLTNLVEHEQITLTYLDGVGALLDPQDRTGNLDIEPDIDFEHLFQFGYGSGDENIIYIRNDRLEHDYEIIRTFDPGEETIEHSYEPRVRHLVRDDKGKPRKFRLDE